MPANTSNMIENSDFLKSLVNNQKQTSFHGQIPGTPGPTQKKVSDLNQIKEKVLHSPLTFDMPMSPYQTKLAQYKDIRKRGNQSMIPSSLLQSNQAQNADNSPKKSQSTQEIDGQKDPTSQTNLDNATRDGRSRVQTSDSAKKHRRASSIDMLKSLHTTETHHAKDFPSLISR